MPAMFSALMYELVVIKSWTKAGNGPSFGLWYLPMLIYDENGTPNLIGFIKYPLIANHILAIIIMFIYRLPL